MPIAERRIEVVLVSCPSLRVVTRFSELGTTSPALILDVGVPTVHISCYLQRLNDVPIVSYTFCDAISGSLVSYAGKSII